MRSTRSGDYPASCARAQPPFVHLASHPPAALFGDGEPLQVTVPDLIKILIFILNNSKVLVLVSASGDYPKRVLMSF